MGRYLWVLFLLTCQGSLYAGEPTAISQERRAGFAYARDLLTKKGVPFDPDLLLQEDWRTRLAGTFDSMPEMRAEREELSGKLKGVYLAGTLVLPEKIILAGDVVILARRVVFLGQNVMIVGPGKSVGFFPIEAVAHGRNAEASPAERHVTIITGSLIPVRPQHEDVMREAQALLCASLDSCDPWKDGYNGVWGERGIDGTDGATGTPGANGAWGSCQGNRDGSPGNEGEWGRDGTNAANGGQGGVGGDAAPIHCDLPGIDGGTYDFYARGGNGGRGGDGGTGGRGGDGGLGGAGGKGAGHCADCTSGSGGSGGRGGWGGRAGRGGNGGGGGQGGNGGSITVSHCRATVRPHYDSGQGGAGGHAGYPGAYGSAAPGGGGGRGGSACGYTSPEGQEGQHGNSGAGNEGGNHGGPGGNGNNGSENVFRRSGCDGGGGDDDCDRPGNPPCCSEGDEEACLSDPACFWIYGTCECWCPSERPGLLSKKPSPMSRLSPTPR